MARHLDEDVTTKLDVLVFDEAHHVAANEFGNVWRHLTDEADPILALGLSATPTRTDQSEISQFRSAFDRTLFVPELLGTDPMTTLINKGVLAHPEFHRVPDVPKFERWKGPSDQRTLQSLVSSPDRWSHIINCLRSSNLGRTVVYALDRKHGKALTRHLRHLGEKAEYIDGETTYPERVGVLERFRDGATRILVNVALLIEGIDCPAAESVFLTYPVDSDIMFRQMVGRVLRGPLIGGTDRGAVWAVEGSQEQMERRLYGDGLALAGWAIEKLS
jgi:superfamily II DNA or RNA helicase